MLVQDESPPVFPRTEGSGVLWETPAPLTQWSRPGPHAYEQAPTYLVPVQCGEQESSFPV